MKKTLSLITACVLCTTGAFAQALNYEVEGNVKGVADGTTIVLVPVTKSAPMAETTIQNGKFSFSGTVDEYTGVRVMVKDTWEGPSVILGEGKVSVKGDNGFKSAVSEGGIWTTKYNAILYGREILNQLYFSNEQVFAGIRKKIGEARGSGNMQLYEDLQTKDELGIASHKADSLFFATVEKVYKKAAMDNKDTFLGPLSMLSLFAYLNAEQRPWYEAFSKEAQESQYGKIVRKDVGMDSGVGTQAPTFTVTDAKGKQKNLADFIKGKKVILLDFWASWCNPCRKEIPNVKAQYEKWAKKGFEVISISIDKKEADWQKALKEENLAWPNFRDTDGSIADAYSVKAIPAMFLLDNNGVIIMENARGEALAKKLEELLK